MRGCKPTNAYGESKLLVEAHARLVQRDPRPALASRCATSTWPERPKGPDGVIRGEAHEPESHLIPLILDVALGRRASIRIYGDDYPTPDGTCIRDYIHVSDLADAHLLALKALETEAAAKIGLIFNLGNGQGFSVREVIESARRVTGHPIPAEMHPRRAGRPRRARRQLREGHPRTGLEAALYPARRHRPHRLGLAPEALQELIRPVWQE